MKKESYLALTWPGPARPSPLAWCQSSPTSASRQRRDTATPPRAPRRHLLAARASGGSGRRPRRPLDRPDTSFAPYTSPLPRLRHGRRCRARAGVNLAATVLPSPSRAVQQLRLDALVLSAESGNAERPASPPAPSTSPPLLRDRRRPPDVVSPSPTALFAST